MESRCSSESSASLADVRSSMSLGKGSEGRPWETVAAKSKISESERIFIIVFGMLLF